ncbi:MAG: YigZ family protein [Gammaproteobacteria bacterium]|nr:YigZ family protein [Gammaproteobacteria bacterium]
MTDSSGYLIPAQSVEVITEIKRSRFIAHIAHGSNAIKAFHIIEQVKHRYPDARHHCWAFIACAPKSACAVRFSDAGEPSGTAGKPILNILQHSHYGEIVCVVSRYFGGIKLGAGGLIRAYSNSTQAALEQLTSRVKFELSPVNIQFPYPFESSVRHYLNSSKVTIKDVNYHEQVIFQLAIEQTLIAPLIQHVQNLCKGDMKLIDPDEKLD